MNFEEVLQEPSELFQLKEKLEEVQWYHWTSERMVKGGNSAKEEFEPYVKWSDIEEIIGE